MTVDGLCCSITFNTCRNLFQLQTRRGGRRGRRVLHGSQIQLHFTCRKCCRHWTKRRTQSAYPFSDSISTYIFAIEMDEIMRSVAFYWLILNERKNERAGIYLCRSDVRAGGNLDNPLLRNVIWLDKWLVMMKDLGRRWPWDFFVSFFRMPNFQEWHRFTCHWKMVDVFRLWWLWLFNIILMLCDFRFTTTSRCGRWWAAGWSSWRSPGGPWAKCCLRKRDGSRIGWPHSIRAAISWWRHPARRSTTSISSWPPASLCVTIKWQQQSKNWWDWLSFFFSNGNLIDRLMGSGERIAGGVGNARSVFQLLATVRQQDDGVSAGVPRRQRHLHAAQHTNQVPRGAAEGHVHIGAVPARCKQRPVDLIGSLHAAFNLLGSLSERQERGSHRHVQFIAGRPVCRREVRQSPARDRQRAKHPAEPLPRAHRGETGIEGGRVPDPQPAGRIHQDVQGSWIIRDFVQTMPWRVWMERSMRCSTSSRPWRRRKSWPPTRIWPTRQDSWRWTSPACSTSATPTSSASATAPVCPRPGQRPVSVRSAGTGPTLWSRSWLRCVFDSGAERGAVRQPQAGDGRREADGDVQRLHVVPSGDGILQVRPGRVWLPRPAARDAAGEPGQGASRLLLPQEARHAATLLEDHVEVSHGNPNPWSKWGPFVIILGWIYSSGWWSGPEIIRKILHFGMAKWSTHETHTHTHTHTPLPSRSLRPILASDTFESNPTTRW